jgi:hypothetical protein
VAPKLPFSFQQPSDEVMEQISALLPNLPIQVEEAILKRKSRAERRRSRKGSGSELRHAVRQTLDQDYAEHVAEAKDVAYFFEYVVQYDGESLGSQGDGLFVATRLFAPQQAGSGSIYYGSFIYRVGDDAYLYWLSD